MSAPLTFSVWAFQRLIGFFASEPGSLGEGQHPHIVRSVCAYLLFVLIFIVAPVAVPAVFIFTPAPMS